MKYILAIAVIAIAAAAWFFITAPSTPPGGAGGTVQAATMAPKDRMRAVAESMGMKLQMYVDSGGGNVTFAVRVPAGNAKTAQDFLEAVKRDNIVADAMQISMSELNDNFNGRQTETQFQGSLRQ